MELLPVLSLDDIRVRREIRGYTKVERPSVSYLAQLSLLSRHDKIGHFEMLKLFNGDYLVWTVLA